MLDNNLFSTIQASSTFNDLFKSKNIFDILIKIFTVFMPIFPFIYKKFDSRFFGSVHGSIITRNVFDETVKNYIKDFFIYVYELLAIFIIIIYINVYIYVFKFMLQIRIYFNQISYIFFISIIYCFCLFVIFMLHVSKTAPPMKYILIGLLINFDIMLVPLLFFPFKELFGFSMLIVTPIIIICIFLYLNSYGFYDKYNKFYLKLFLLIKYWSFIALISCMAVFKIQSGLIITIYFYYWIIFTMLQYYISYFGYIDKYAFITIRSTSKKTYKTKNSVKYYKNGKLRIKSPQGYPKADIYLDINDVESISYRRMHSIIKFRPSKTHVTCKTNFSDELSFHSFSYIDSNWIKFSSYDKRIQESYIIKSKDILEFCKFRN